jgi:hypothetical protein
LFLPWSSFFFFFELFAVFEVTAGVAAFGGSAGGVTLSMYVRTASFVE